MKGFLEADMDCSWPLLLELVPCEGDLRHLDLLGLHS
jgi:hypothetical protein